MSVSIVTDSGCDYTPTEAQGRAIEIVPMWLIYGDERLRDGVDIDRAQFYARFRRSKELPRTEPATVPEYEAVFANHVSAGNEVVCISVSSALSKAFSNAVEAAATFSGTVRVVNSAGSAAGMNLLCDYALELAAAGAPASEIAQRISVGDLRRATFFAMPDVSQLAESGRMPKALAALGAMLNVSLVLKMDEKGAVGPAGQSRNFEKTCEIMVDSLVRAIERAPSARVAISHADAPELAASLKAQLGAKLGTGKIAVSETAAPIASHLGVGAAGVFGIVP